MTASPVFTTVLKSDPYTEVPCAYLICEQDRGFPAAYQEGMVAMQSSRAGVDITMYRAPCGHSPHLVWTEGLVEKVNEFGQRSLASIPRGS